MDAYELVLDMSFFNLLDALILPNENIVVLLDPKCSCIVRDKRENEIATKFLSAIQLSKGVYKR